MTVCVLCLLAIAASLAVAAPLDVGSQKQLFIDQRFIESSRGVRLVMNRPRKLGPVMRADRPWEAAQMGAYCTIIREGDLFRMWYDCIAAIRPQEIRFVAYATSSDGITWRKNPLGVFEFNGDRDNNILFQQTEGSVFIDPHAKPEERYRYAGMLPYKGIVVNTSPDGIHWKLGTDPVLPFWCDSQAVAFWDDRIGKYTAYVRNWTPLRAISRAETDDIMKPWPYDAKGEPSTAFGDSKPPALGRQLPVVFHYDEQDPPDSDHYTPCVIKYPYAADAYFLFTAAYLHYPGPPEGKYNNDGPLEIQMATSRDGVKWDRLDRSAFIPLGEQGSGEEGCLYAFPSLVRVGDELWLYYTGYPLTHGPDQPTYGGTIRRVALRLDGFVAAAFDWNGGSLTTPLLAFTGNRLELNIDTGAMGSAQVELLSADGSPIPGHALTDCDRINGNFIRKTVTWHGQPEINAAGPLRLRIVARNSGLYAFQFRPVTSSTPNPGPAANDPTSADPGHPRVFATADEIDRARERAQKYDWAKAAYDRIIARADQALAGELAVPDKGGQWTHYYTCPKHGVGLKTESPTRHMCPIDGEIFRGWPYDDVAISFIHHKYTADLENLGLAFAFTRDPRYAERAGAILLAYADRYSRYQLHDVKGTQRATGGKRFAQTLDEAVGLISIVWAYDLIYDTIPSADRERIERDFLRPSVEVIQRHRAGKSNWQSWHNAAIGVLGFCLGDEALIRTALDDSEHGFRYQMRESVLSDGWWYEGAPSYHFYALSALIYLAEAAYRAGVNLYDARFKSLFDAPFELAYPDFTLPALNDSDRFPLSPQKRPYEIAATRFREDRYNAVLASGARGGFEALLWGPEQIGRAAELHATSVNLGGLGCAVLRDGAGPDAQYLLLDYGPHGGGHGHPEKLQTVLYGLGQELAPDPGRLAYSVPMHASWYRQTLAHNAIVVDQTSQQATEGKLALFHAGSDFQVARALAAGAYEGVGLDRTVVVTPGYILDVFRAHSASPHTYDWVYHNAGRMSSDLIAFECKKPLAKDAGYQHLGHLRRAEAPGAWALEWQVDPATGAEGGGRVRVVGADGCGPAELFFADAPSQPPTERMTLVICRRSGEGAVFITASELLPNGGGETTRQPLVQSVSLTGWVGPPRARGLAITVMTTNGPDSFWVADDPEAPGAQVVYVPAGGEKHIAP